MTVAAPSAITGLVMASLFNEFGWSRAEVSANILVTSFCALVCAPFANRLITRFGTRRVALAGFVSTAAGFALVGLSGPSLLSWLAAWVAYGVLSVFLGPMAWSSAVSSLFDRHRGLALSIALSGSGFAFAVWPPLLAPIIAAYDWRWAYLALAIFCIVVLLPLNAVALRALERPAPSGADTPAAQSHAATDAWGPTLGEALRGLLFWRILLAFVLSAAVNGSLLIHFHPILRELEFPLAQATYLTAAIGPAMIVGRIGTGWLMDRFFAPYVVAIALFLPALTLGILISGPNVGTALVASVLLGLSTGAVTGSAALLTSRYFGLRHYPGIFGVLISVFGISFGMIPTIAGHFYDVVGSYRPLFAVLLAAILPIGLLLATLGRYPDAGSAEQ